MVRPPHAESFASLTHRDLSAALRRHRLSAWLLTLLLVPTFLVGVFLIPAQFDSYGQLLVRLGRGSVSMDPTTSLTQTVSLQESRTSQVNSVIELLHSRALTERVVRQVGAERILEPHSLVEQWLQQATAMIPRREAQALGKLSAEDVAAQLQHEEACKAFESMFTVLSAKDAYTINLEVRSGDPFLSRDLMQAIMEEYQAYHVRAHQSTGSLAFFETQTEQAFEKAVQAKDKLREAKTARGIIEVDAAKLALRDLISQAESDLLTTESDIAASQSEQDKLADDIAGLPTKVQTDTVTGIPKVTGNSMRQSLYDLEVEYQALSAKLKQDHPRLRAVREQLGSAAEIAKSEVGDQPQTRQALNPIRQSLELSLRTAQSRLAGLQSKKNALKAKLAEFKDQMAQLNRDEVDLAQLSWKASLTESNYLRAAESRDQAKQLSDLDVQMVSEISVAQPATLGLKKSKPRRSVLAILAVLLAGTIGFGQAIIRGLFHPDANQGQDASQAAGQASGGQREAIWRDQPSSGTPAEDEHPEDADVSTEHTGASLSGVPR